MLNNSSSVSVSNHVNAVSGNIIKTYRDSYFKRFSLCSPLAETLFKEKSETIIIQMTVCGDMDVIAELISREKYNEMMDDVKEESIIWEKRH